MDSSNLHLYDYLYLLRRKKLTLIGCFAVMAMAAACVNIIQAPVYRSQAEVLVEAEQSAMIMGASHLTMNQLDNTYFFTLQRVLLSRPVAELVLAKAEQETDGIKKIYAALGREGIPGVGMVPERDKEEVIGGIRGSLGFETVPRTRVLLVSATGADPEGVAYLANTAADVFVHKHAELQMTSSQRQFMNFTEKLQELKDSLNVSEFALQKVNLELDLIGLLKDYDDKHPEVVQLRSEIDNFSRYLEQEVGKVRVQLGEDEAEREGRENVLFSYLASDSAKQGQGVEARRSLSMFLEQEVKSNREMYYTMFRQLKELSLVDEQVAKINLKIMQGAGVPGRPIRPNKRLNLLFGCVAGLVLGIGMAFFQDYLDNTIKNSEDVKKYLGLSVLGTIPALETDRKLRKTESSGGIPKHRLMSLEDASSAVSEAYRNIRTNLLLVSVDNPLRTLAVSSCAQKEGKTTVAVNLGISIARAGSRVLLVDADLRRPSLEATLGRKGWRGGSLVEILTGGSSVEEALCPTEVENLTVLPCGKVPPNPSELLGSERMRSIVEDLKNRFELVLFDTAPLLGITDTVVLSRRMDGVMLVTSAGTVPRNIAAQAKKSLDIAKANVLGVVLNNVAADQGNFDLYHYQQYYSAYAQSASRSQDIPVAKS